MIHMNVYLLSDGLIMAMYGIIFSQTLFYGIVGHVDEPHNNGLSKDNQ